MACAPAAACDRGLRPLDFAAWRAFGPRPLRGPDPRPTADRGRPV